jgi:uncharacterized protein (DUF2235 family)
MPGRNIVVCCDGTANEFAENKTNVIKLYSVLDHDSIKQIAYYHPGLGTMEPAGALTNFARKVTKLLGQAVGYGLSTDIQDAYVFLMKEFRDQDRLFLFGFSRGAYTARALASFLRMYGLIREGNEAQVPYAIRMMMGIHRAEIRKDKEASEKYFALAREFKATMCSIQCKPHFVGVWDTVSSVGWVENPLRLPYTANNSDIGIGRHAIAIDEHRAFFRTNLWMRPQDEAIEWGPKNVKQVWFPGVHCDVGGGYAEAESGLSKLALDWMLQEAKAAGLFVLPEKEKEVLGINATGKFVMPDPNAGAHESLSGAWNIAEFIPKRHYNWKKKCEERRMNFYRRRTIPPGSLVHESVFERQDNYAKRVPSDAVRASTLPTSPIGQLGAANSASGGTK